MSKKMNKSTIKVGFAGVASSVRTIKNISQLVSLSFATLCLWSIFTDGQGATGFIMALLVALSIEIASHRQGMSHFYIWQKFGFKKNVRWLSAMSWIILLMIFATNPMTSYIGSEQAGDLIKPDIVSTDMTEVDSIKNDERDLIISQFKSDSTTVETLFNNKRKSIYSKYQGQINDQEQRIKNRMADHKRGNKWAMGHIREARRNITKLKAERSSELDALTADKFGRMALVMENRDSSNAALSSLVSLRSQDLISVHQMNQGWDVSTWITSTWFMRGAAVGCSILSFICMWFLCRYLVKSGIEPDEIDFLKQHFVTRVSSALYERLTNLGDRIVDYIKIDETKRTKLTKPDEIDVPETDEIETQKPLGQNKRRNESEVDEIGQNKRRNKDDLGRNKRRNGDKTGQNRTKKVGRKSSEEKIRKAYRELVKKGVEIDAKSIAEQAGVSPRTVSRHLDKVKI